MSAHHYSRLRHLSSANMSVREAMCSCHANTHLAAVHWIISICCVSCTVCGNHTRQAVVFCLWLYLPVCPFVPRNDQNALQATLLHTNHSYLVQWLTLQWTWTTFTMTNYYWLQQCFALCEGLWYLLAYPDYIHRRLKRSTGHNIACTYSIVAIVIASQWNWNILITA